MTFQDWRNSWLEARGITRLPGCKCWQCNSVNPCCCGTELLTSGPILNKDGNADRVLHSTPLDSFLF